MRYNFPATKFISNSPNTQIDHVLSECEEVIEAFCDPLCPLGTCHMEMADLYHSLETFWRIIGDEETRRIFAEVEEKNRARGYYL